MILNFLNTHNLFGYPSMLVPGSSFCVHQGTSSSDNNHIGVPFIRFPTPPHPTSPYPVSWRRENQNRSGWEGGVESLMRLLPKDWRENRQNAFKQCKSINRIVMHTERNHKNNSIESQCLNFYHSGIP
jgi:hypothetical protein